MKSGGKLNRIISIISYSIVAIIVLCTVYVLYFNLKDKPAFFFGHSAMWVKTQSMEPVIPAKSYILVKKAKAEDVRVGDIIVFYSDDPTLRNSLNTHKVIGTTKGQDGKTEFITKGVKNYAKDKVNARADKVVGIYERRLPILSAFGRFLSKPEGITITMILIAVIMFATFLPSVIESIRERSKKAQMDALLKSEVEKLKSRDKADGK